MVGDPHVQAILNELGLSIGGDGTIELFHATTEEAAAAIREAGALHGADGLVYFATHPAIASRIVEQAEGVLKCRVLVDDLVVHRRPDELEYLDDPQAEFLVIVRDDGGYAPVEMGDFVRVSRDDH